MAFLLMSPMSFILMIRGWALVDRSFGPFGRVSIMSQHYVASRALAFESLIFFE
jgi:hypothetical protein